SNSMKIIFYFLYYKYDKYTKKKKKNIIQQIL
ncbi:hypothetical protein, partial [Plasmodium yoelii yoelii]